jgi:phosphoribosylaminoimidazole-succinocarboxamide synthase
MHAAAPPPGAVPARSAAVRSAGSPGPPAASRSPSRRKDRGTRGEHWLHASCSATMVIENTSPANVSTEEATTPRICWALLGPPANSRPPASAYASSISVTSGTVSTAATTQVVGSSQNCARNRRYSSPGLTRSVQHRAHNRHSTRPHRVAYDTSDLRRTSNVPDARTAGRARRRRQAGRRTRLRRVDTIAELPGVVTLPAGKVRERYLIDDTLLLVASDRISAFDVVLPTPVPDKGAVLTAMSDFWFDELDVAHHRLTCDPAEFPLQLAPVAEQLRGRAMLCRRAEPLPVECVVRGYLSGSAWVEYLATGSVSGIRLPADMVESQRLPVPIFTPATKAAAGHHDENISFGEMTGMLGAELSAWLRDSSLALYAQAAEHAGSRGLILADTKFEFGLIDGTPALIDEVCTPDSSRYWSAAEYAPGQPQHAYDKQFVRDWLRDSGWDREPPGPELPSDVVARTRERYVQAYETVTGRSFSDWMA